MCGRYVSVSSPTILAERFQVEEVRAEDNEPNYNVTPRLSVPVVAESHGHRTLDLVRWGLVPSWAKDLAIGDRLINARAESILTSNAFKRAFTKRRCIIPADGFYEWEKLEGDDSAATEGERSVESTQKKRKKVKQPWFIRRRDGEPLAFAGLWEIWHDPNDPDQEHAPRVRSCVIITTEPNDLMRPIHNRMPVVLPESAWAEWLDGENHDTDTLQKLLVPAPAEEFERWPITTLVNKPANNGPELLERAPVASA
jgi:putative SOS response-associated peptidase YedK